MQIGPGPWCVHERNLCYVGRHAAVGASYDAFLPDDLGLSNDLLSDEFRVFDVVGREIDHAWDQELVVRQFCVLEDFSLVLVPRVGAL